jgi:hypothetical protein
MLALVVVLPTPPLPEVTTMILGYRRRRRAQIGRQQQANGARRLVLRGAAAAHRQQAQPARLQQLAQLLKVDLAARLLGRQGGQIEHHAVVLEEIGHVAVLGVQLLAQPRQIGRL